MIIQKRGALELSVGTIVVIVIAMTMLILGLTLVRTIFAGSTYNVEQLNKATEAELTKLFNQNNDKIIFYLPNREAEVKKGQEFIVNFLIKNRAEGESQPGKFTYDIKATDIQTGCQLTLAQADSYLILGKTGSFDLAPGDDPVTRQVRVHPSSTAPLCSISYDLVVRKDGQPYDTQFFTVKIA